MRIYRSVSVVNLSFLGIHLKGSLNRNVALSASKQKQTLKNFFEITSRVSILLIFSTFCIKLACVM